MRYSATIRPFNRLTYFMEREDKIYIAGHRGMVGSALLRALQFRGYRHFVLKTSAELDLRDQLAVRQFFEQEKPTYVFLAAAKVGGIAANNTFRAEFLYDNIMIQSNIIEAAYRTQVRKLLFLGSSCIYPKMAPQPLKEEYLLTGPLEPTNEPYAIAKIAGIKLCDAYRMQYGCNFISAMPTNLYGPNDNYNPETSHVLPALIRKFYSAVRNKDEVVTVWGTGKVRREFLHTDDLAEACLHLMLHHDEPGHINIGVGEDIAISELAVLIGNIAGFTGAIEYDTSKPDGTPRKLMDVTKMQAMGWKARISLQQGVEQVYKAFQHSQGV